MSDEIERPVYVWSVGKIDRGEVLDELECDMEGCRGTVLKVKWADGKVTYPCTKGMGVIDESDWIII